MTKGIVINTGGSTYFTNAYVCVRMLRHLGCILPIELWYKDKGETDPRMFEMTEGLNVQWVNASVVRKQFPMRKFGGWERKPYSMLHCGFDQVMMLDSDIVPAVDPTYLWANKSFTKHGCLFWPDGHTVPANAAIWRECMIEPDPGRSFQGGQQMVDVWRCREALKLTIEMNENSEKWYKLTYGEQDLYRMAWKITRTPYTLIDVMPSYIEGTILEFDNDGQLVFQHRCNCKWRLTRNAHVEGFKHEKLCLSFIEDLVSAFPDWVAQELDNQNRQYLLANK